MSMSVSMRRRDNYLILMLMFKLVLLLTLTPSSFLPDAKSVGSGIGALLVVAALTCLSGVFTRRSLAPQFSQARAREGWRIAGHRNRQGHVSQPCRYL